MKKRKIIYSFLITTLLIFFIIFNNQRTLFYFGNLSFGQMFYNINLAEAFIKRADSLKSNDVKYLHYQLSRIHFIKGNLNNALLEASEELNQHPDNCQALYIRGLSYGYIDNLDSAISDFETFNKCIPDTWAGHNDLAWFWFRKGDMQKVVDIVEEVSWKYPYNPWLMNTYGTALMNLKRYNEAKYAFEKAKYSADNMTEADWGASYPGNDPRIYEKGLKAMRDTINSNLEIIEKNLSTVK